MRGDDCIKLFEDRGLQVGVIKACVERIFVPRRLSWGIDTRRRDAGELDVLSRNLLVLKSASV